MKLLLSLEHDPQTGQRVQLNHRRIHGKLVHNGVEQLH